MSEENCYEVIETCLEHPNLEIIQLAETLTKDKKKDELDEKIEKKDKKDKNDKNKLTDKELN